MQVAKEGHVAFYLLSVITHEIGHVIGLTHSHFEEDVMSPYYKVLYDVCDSWHFYMENVA